MSNRFKVNLKRIVAVDSASFAYEEVKLDNNLVLLGTGNWGKTSIINAVRFFLLPEVNLRHCKKKFSFKTGKNTPDEEYYTNVQVLDYYFPSNNSRLILEVEHELIGGGKKRHCQIIGKGSNFDLQRFFIPVPYEDLCSLFWDKSIGVCGGKPQIVPGKNLLSALKHIHKSAIHVRNVEELQKYLYQVDVLNPTKCPYVIYPLHSVDSGSIESLRALIKLLFNQDSNSLKLMTAAAIEAQDGRGKKLEVDIQSLVTEHERLEKDREELLKLKKAKPRFDKLHQEYQTHCLTPKYETDYAQLIIDIQACNHANSHHFSALLERLKPLLRKWESSEQELKAMQAERDNNTREQEKLNKEFTKHQEHLTKCEVVCSQYPDYSVEQVIEAIKEHLDGEEGLVAKWDNYNNESSRHNRLITLKQNIATEEQSLRKITERLANQEHLLRNQVSDFEAKVLNTINPKLIDANPKRKLSEAELNVFTDFVQCFSPKGGEVSFYDESFPLVELSNGNDLEAHLEQLKQKISDYKDEENELSRYNTDPSLHDAHKIAQLKREIEHSRRDISMLERASYSIQRNSVIKQELEALESVLTTLNQEIETATLSRDKAKSRHDRLEGERLAAEAKSKYLAPLVQHVNLDLDRYPNVRQRTEQLEKSSDKRGAYDFQLDELKKYADKLEEAKESKEIVISNLMQFCILGILKDEHGILENNREQTALSKSFESLAIKFATINQSEEQVQSDTATHNLYIRNRLELLDKTKNKIEHTISRLNAELSEASINDLDAVELRVSLNGAFEDLVSSWSEFDDLDSRAILPKEWYLRLEEFLSSDAVDPKDGKLRIESIIKHVRYEVKKVGGLWDGKGQSTSTQMLINMHFCDAFIHKLCNDTSAISFPLILDEVGQVSSEQFPPLIKTINKNGHTLIGATTHGKSSELIDPFGHFQIMDETSTGRPYDAQRCKVSYLPEPEYIVKREDQLAMFEEG